MAGRRQVNIRINEDEAARLEALTDRAYRATGLHLKQADLFRVGLEEFERRYPPHIDEPRGRKKKGG